LGRILAYAVAGGRVCLIPALVLVAEAQAAEVVGDAVREFFEEGHAKGGVVYVSKNWVE
jgi:hypothetical protein